MNLIMAEFLKRATSTTQLFSQEQVFLFKQTPNTDFYAQPGVQILLGTIYFVSLPWQLSIPVIVPVTLTLKLYVWFLN